MKIDTYKITLTLVVFYFCINSFYAQVENCLDFNGSGDYVKMGDVNDLGISDFTIEAWIKIDNTFENKIITKGGSVYQSPASTGYGLRTSYSGPGILDFFVGEGGFTVVKYNGIQPNTWYHVAGVRRGTELLLYLDGVLVAGKTAPFIYNTNNNGPFAIGAMDKGPNSSVVDEFMDGEIDEVRIWNIARTQEEIQNNMNCAISAPEAHLVAVYNFDQTSGTTVIDASGHDVHGYFVNNPIWTPSAVALICQVSSIENNNVLSNVKLYPNPASHTITIEFSDMQSRQQIQIYNANGQLVKAVAAYSQVPIDVSDLPSGLYLIQMENERNSRLKFIKE